jgi:hypothetical protein
MSRPAIARHAAHLFSTLNIWPRLDGLNAQAQKLAREWFEEISHTAAGGNITAGPYTVGDALTDYMGWFRAHRKSVLETQNVIDTHIRPALGQVEVIDLAASQVRDWHRSLATAPARVRSARRRQQRNRPSDEDPETTRRRRSTANRVLTVLKAALNHAWREGRTESDSAWHLHPPTTYLMSRLCLADMADSRGHLCISISQAS